MGHKQSRLTSQEDAQRAALRAAAEKNGFYSTAVGPPSWAVLHCVAANFPHDLKTMSAADQAAVAARYRGFLQAFAQVFPCANCRPHFERHVAAIDPAHFSSRTAFCTFVYDLHNQVTEEVRQRCVAAKKTPPPTQSVTKEQMFTLYESLRCPPAELRHTRPQIYGVVKFQGRPEPGGSIKIDPAVALNSADAIRRHVLNGGWVPGQDV
jgi:hypothetical protein